MGSSGTQGPDFICVGLPKAGTGWLFDQLQYHPDFWMPPLKELHYLASEKPRMRNAAQRLKHREKRRAKNTSQLLPAYIRPGDQRDHEFLTEVSASAGMPMDLARYVSFYRFKGDLLSGDISPGYCALTEQTIHQIATALPHTKIILLVRDPVARAWSRISMAHRNDELDVSLLEDAERFRSFLEAAPYIRERSFASKTFERWAKAAPAAQLRWFFFDDIVSRSNEVRRDILSYLGADPDKSSGELAASYNRKAENEKLPLSDRLREVLVNHFEDELRACARIFGGDARSWPEQYGI